MKRRINILIVCISLSFINANAQAKVVGECAIQFSIFQTKLQDTVFIGSKSVLVKGNQCKTVLTSPHFTQGLHFNIQESKAIITKEIGAAKFLQEINYPPANMPTLLSMKEIAADSAIVILGYTCKRMELRWSDGAKYDLYYTNEIIPTVNTFEYAFKEVPGLVLAYTIISEQGVAIQYLATQLDLSPLSLSQFNINTNLYQVLD